MNAKNAKIITARQDLAQVAACLREQQKRIVATNGCFDILHVGHVRYLQASRNLGDVLIVGINSDASVRKLKGPDRPVNNESDRAEVLLALGCVDYVTIFDESTACEFLKAVRPQIYTKGGDYSSADFPEATVVKSFGGKTMLLELVPGKSTSNIITQISAQKQS